jgi:DNA-binding beta-propeller fold protein YncE
MNRILKLIGAGLAIGLLGLSAKAEILYGADGANANPATVLMTINTATGATTTIGPIGFAVTGLAFSPVTGILYGSTGAASPVAPNSIITINRFTGAGTLVGATGLGGPVADITFRSDGTLFGWSEASDDLVTINTTTGVATVVSDSGLGTSGSGIAFSGAGALFFAGDSGSLHTISPTTGLVTSTVALGAPSRMNALAFSGETGTLFGTLGGTLYTIDPTTGTVTTIGATAANIDAIVFAAGPNPAPTLSEWNMILLGLLLAGTAMWAIRKRRA